MYDKQHKTYEAMTSSAVKYVGRASNKTVNEQLQQCINEAKKDLTLVAFQRDFHGRRGNTKLVDKYTAEEELIKKCMEFLVNVIQKLPPDCVDHTLVPKPDFDTSSLLPRNYFSVFPVVRIQNA